MIRRRHQDETNISFLDVICCGFGAIVLLLVIVQTQSPDVLESSETDRRGQIRALQEELFALRGDINYLERELNARQEQLGIETERVAILRRTLEDEAIRLAALDREHEAASGERGNLFAALQTLTEEMRRLYASYQSNRSYIGGIPVDSEYIIFVIDTSGSMYHYAWSRMIDEIVNILDIYPRVRGVQIMNDMGQYMFQTYRGEWMPDTPERRRIIVSQLQRWNAFSNSSPIEGVQNAIRTFANPEHKISIYVMGDDYTGRSLSAVLDGVRSANSRGADGKPMVRIHAIGFPVMYAAGEQAQAARYAALMRAMTQQNLGSFVGLNDYR